jgi:DNA helicase HerA-like ATPase
MTLYESRDPVIEQLGLVEVKIIGVPQILGLISTSLSSESTQDEFYFWVDHRRLVEATQLVRVTMPLPSGTSRIEKLGTDAITVIGIVEEVRRQSESRTLGADYARYDGLVENQPLLPPTGFTYAHCRVLDIDPPLFVPLMEGLPVYLASEEEAGRGYNYPAMDAAGADLTMGLLRNGGVEVAGAAKLDTRYMLGEFGGHVNVTGVAGTGTKTSFLMVLVKMLLLHAGMVNRQASADPLFIVPIVFNVKGNDLMWLSRPNKNFNVNSSEWDIYRRIWGEELFSKFAQPFTEAIFYSYSTKDGALKPGLPEGTKKYSWGLKDVIEWGVEKYLFSAESRSQELMQGVLEDAFQYISKKSSNALSGQTLDTSKVKNFEELVKWLREATEKVEQNNESKATHYLIGRQHDKSTIKAAARRLNNILSAARGVLRIDSASGEPPEITQNQNSDPIVIDIDGLEAAPQRFVVAAIIERVKQHREQHAERRQRYVLVLDELNRFAPKGSSDEVSKLFEHVAAQLRSQGIILFGAQQKASSISPLVWENAATKALGRTGAVELAADMWRQLLPAVARTRAANLGGGEKIILQDHFTYPMLANIPFTPWATRKDEIGLALPDGNDDILSQLDLGDGT